MPPKLPEGYLFDILETARKIERFIAGDDQQHFSEDEKTISALERQNGLIQHSEHGFRRSTFVHGSAMRNFIVHHYDRVDLEKLWRTANEDVPRIIRVLEPFLRECLPKEQEREPSEL